jgi:predicted alpha/beta superfamily hydrolase
MTLPKKPVCPMRVLTPLLLLFLLPQLGAAQGRYNQAVDIGTVDSIWSATLDEQRPYLVYTPPSYGDTTSTPQDYPVLYLLDGNAHFHSVTGLIQILATGVNGTFAIPEMIVVAIPNTDRTRDLTPTRPALGFDGEPTPDDATSGGNRAFFTFLEDELIPHIESEFRTMPYRVFIGHSLGGITAINALYTIPETFDAYVAIDPSLWWDDLTLLRQAKDYFMSADLGGKALYVAQANTIQPDDLEPNAHFSAITQFDAIMRAHDRSGVRYAFKYYDEDDHGSVPLISEYDALRFIFDGYRVPLQRVMAEPALLMEHFNSVSEQLGETFQPSEAMVRLVASFAIGQDTTAAIALGEIRAELYPESYRAQEFLGDVWAAKGEVEKARGYYEQALAKNPGSEAIRDKLSALAG